MDETIWSQVAKLAIYAMFVESIVEVVKVFNVKDLVQAILKTWRKEEWTVAQIKLFTFVIALTGCALGDYGVIARIIELGKNASGVQWFDFIGTAAVVSRGSGIMYDYVSSWRAKWSKQESK